MKFKTLLAVAVAGAFAVPFAAQASADGDRIVVAQAGGAGGAGGAAGGAAGGGSGGAAGGTTTAPSGTHPQGSPSPRTPAGAPTGSASTGTTTGSASGGTMSGDSAMFSSIDKNNDGQISRSEWDAYQRSAASGASGSPSSAPASRSGASHGVGTK